MKYKVGDKVKVRSDLRVGNSYGEHAFVHDMSKFRGKIVTIESAWKQCYRIEEDAYWWTDEMLEPVEEMSAEEMIKGISTMCEAHSGCVGCQIRHLDSDKGCVEILGNYYEDVVEILKHWKADHEKKPIETEFAHIVRVIEDTDGMKKCVYEEDIPYSEDWEEAQVRVLKEYCETHNGKFLTVMESICRVKE